MPTAKGSLRFAPSPSVGRSFLLGWYPCVWSDLSALTPWKGFVSHDNSSKRMPLFPPCSAPRAQEEPMHQPAIMWNNWNPSPTGTRWSQHSRASSVHPKPHVGCSFGFSPVCWGVPCFLMVRAPRWLLIWSGLAAPLVLVMSNLAKQQANSKVGWDP